jgi:hypothetical protein
MLISSRQPRGKQLLGDEHRKWSADRAADETQLQPTLCDPVELGVVAGPCPIAMCAIRSPQPTHHVAVRIEDADFRPGRRGEALLPAGLT